MANQCFAEWDCSGMGGWSCELPAGHEGQHRVTIEWDEEPRRPLPPEAPEASGYSLFLIRRYGRG